MYTLSILKYKHIYIKYSFYYLCFIILKFHAKSKNSKTFQSTLSFIFAFFWGKPIKDSQDQF